MIGFFETPCTHKMHCPDLNHSLAISICHITKKFADVLFGDSMGNPLNEHYLRSAASLGDSRIVFTNQAIMSREGQKLLDSDVRFDSSHLETLIDAKLLSPIEQFLIAEDGITPSQLMEYAQNLLRGDSSPCLQRFRSETETSERILRAIQAITLIPPLAFKLTVMHDQQPELFDHSMRMMLISLYLGIKYGLQDHVLVTTATAAVFHDIGMLHVNPSLMTHGRRLVKHERHHLYSHPILAYKILREYPEYHPAVSTAVYEHHERLDGSGYPRGLKGNEISLHSQILMVAEIACTLFSGDYKKSAMRLSVMLKLTPQKLNYTLSNQLFELASSTRFISDKHSQLNSGAALLPTMNLLSEMFRDWKNTFHKVKTQPASPNQSCLIDLVNERIICLQRNLQATGFDLYSPMAVLLQFGDDPEVVTELEFMVLEAAWQFTDILHEARRRTEEVGAAQTEINNWLVRSEVTLMAN